MADINCREICGKGEVGGVCLICGLAKTAHGKVWEGPVCKMFIDDMNLTGEMNLSEDRKKEIYETWKDKSEKDNTAPHDIDEKLMGIDWSEKIKNKYGAGVSVKLIKKGCDVCMGKLETIWSHFNEGQWSMVVGFYEIKKINGVQCLCINNVYYIPFLRTIEDRKLFFGDVGEDWLDKLKELEQKVKEAKTYKGGRGGVAGLTDDRLPFKPFAKLTHDQKIHRLRGVLPDASDDVLKEKAASYQEEINRLLQELSPDKNSPVQTAVKLSSGNARVQGRVSYNNFNRLVTTIGKNITDELLVINNGLLDPIKKTELEGGGEHRAETPAKYVKASGNRKTKKQKKTRKKITKKRVNKTKSKKQKKITKTNVRKRNVRKTKLKKN